MTRELLLNPENTAPEMTSPVKRFPEEPAVEVDAVLATRDVTISYSGVAAVRSLDLDVERGAITAIIGPSGCGKSTLLRSFNRMNDFLDGSSVTGKVLFEGHDIHQPNLDPVELRRRIGMVFQRPNPFPKSIYENVAWGPRMAGYTGQMDELVQRSLSDAALWDEVKDKLKNPGHSLSGGQQQRLCIARALAMSPEVLLMDEPCSALDPIATGRVEELIESLKPRYSVVIVTHNMQQASRLSDITVFMYQGELIEVGPTQRIFTNPERQQTEDYVTGRFG
ncbi:MAG: phosphate transport system ATP-binding protein [Pseudohongiellaceae bacterium]|jgi:phosphate transport system ATP-binding protein